MAYDAITERMRSAAREFERASIDAGFEFAKVEYESGDWSLVNKPESRIFGIDANGKTHRWKEGEHD